MSATQTALEILHKDFMANSLARKIVFGVAGAAVITTAFLFGYNAAKRKHPRFHMRDAEKNEQVSSSLPAKNIKVQNIFLKKYFQDRRNSRKAQTVHRRPLPRHEPLA